MPRLKWTPGLIFLTFLLTACTSLSPQQVELQPVVDTRLRLPGSVSVALEAKDLRTSPIIGYRVSHFEQNAFITLARDARYTLLNSAQQALRQMGAYRIVPSVDDDSGVRISLLLDKLNYDASQHSIRQEVRLDMEMRLVAQYRGQAFTGRYQSEKTYRSPMTPSEEKNQALLNELASETLTRAFNDPRLIEFLRNNG